MPKLGFTHSKKSKELMSLVMRGKRPPLVRFHAKVDKEGPAHPIHGVCWLWTGATFVSGIGYGQFHYHGRPTPAHRYSWEITYGPIPYGLLVLHKCDVPLCVNPDHLFLGTHQDNTDDMWVKGRAVVLKGEQCPWSKLTDTSVRIVCKLNRRGYGYKKLGRMFYVSPMTIARAVRGQSWKHVK